MCVHARICMYIIITCAYVCAYVYVCIYVCIHLYICTCVYICIACMYMLYMYGTMSRHKCICIIRVYVCVYKITYICTYTLKVKLSRPLRSGTPAPLAVRCSPTDLSPLRRPSMVRVRVHLPAGPARLRPVGPLRRARGQEMLPRPGQCCRSRRATLPSPCYGAGQSTGSSCSDIRQELGRWAPGVEPADLLPWH